MKLSRIKIPLCFSLILISLMGLSRQAGHAQEGRQVDVEVTKVRAKISPTFEVALPSGNIYQHFTQDFNNLNMAFTINYNILDNNIAGDILFSYPLGRFIPSTRFALDLDFENYIAPSFSGGAFTLQPTERYVSRKRTIELSLGYRITDHFSITPSFLISDIFKGSFTTSRVVDDGVDLVPKVGFVYNSMQVKDPDKGLFFNGLYYGSVFGMKYRQSFDNPVSLEHSNNLLLHFSIQDTWKLHQKVTLDYPVYVWNEGLTSFYSLGGFDSVRGVLFDSIHAYRFLFLSTNIEHEIFKGTEVPFTPFKLQARIHQFRLFMLVDELLSQECLDISAPVVSYTSVGGGLAFVISGKEQEHFEIKLYAAQQIGEPFAPFIYLRTSLFDLESQL
jgi:hypothetical protein